MLNNVTIFKKKVVKIIKAVKEEVKNLIWQNYFLFVETMILIILFFGVKVYY